LLHGALLIRQAFDPSLCDQWLPRFQRAFLKEDACFHSGHLSDDVYQNFYRYGHVRPQQIPRHQEWVSQILQTPLLQLFLRHLYGTEVCILLNNSIPRRQNADNSEFSIYLHQDYEFIGLLRSGINIWVPLTPVGGDYPGLELSLNCPQHPIFNRDMSSVERDRVMRELKLEPWAIQMQPGDLLLFTFYTIHRTALASTMKHSRFSSEIRVISPFEKELISTPL